MAAELRAGLHRRAEGGLVRPKAALPELVERRKGPLPGPRGLGRRRGGREDEDQGLKKTGPSQESNG